MGDDTDIKTLQLAPVRRPFFEQEIDVLERNGVSSTVLTPPGSEGRTPVAYLRYQWQVLRCALDGDFDLVHANYGLTGPIALAQPERPVVISLWGSEFHTMYRPVIEASAARADAVIVMSDEMADQFGRPCHVIPHGIDMEKFSPRPSDEAKAELGWDPGARHVLFPYDPSRSLKNYPLAESVAAAADEALDSRVELHAVYGVPHDRFPTYVNAADALLLTSDHEGSPNAVREALACNLPVVSLDVGDVRDVAGGARNCRVCESEADLVAGLVEVLASGERSTARERIREYSLERMGRDIRAVYESVLSDRR